LNCGREDMHHHFGFAMLTLASVVLTLPFIVYAKDMANSLRIIAEREPYNKC